MGDHMATLAITAMRAMIRPLFMQKRKSITRLNSKSTTHKTDFGP